MLLVRAMPVRVVLCIVLLHLWHRQRSVQVPHVKSQLLLVAVLLLEKRLNVVQDYESVRLALVPLANGHEPLVRRQRDGSDLLDGVALLDEFHAGPRPRVGSLIVSVLAAMRLPVVSGNRDVLSHIPDAQMPAHGVQQVQLRVTLVEEHEPILELLASVRKVGAKVIPRDKS